MDGWVCIGVDKYAKSEYRKGTVILTSSNAFIIILRLKISLTNYSENKSDVNFFSFMRRKEKFIQAQDIPYNSQG